MLNPHELQARLRQIKLVVLDVDGVLTDGGIILGASEEMKTFNALDGHGIRLLFRFGVRVAIITGRKSACVQRRAAELGIEDLVEGAKFKLPAHRELLARLGLRPEEALYVGDDLPDLPPMRNSGVGVAVANAHDELLARADWVTRKGGGHGAVREVVDAILKAQGNWDDALRRYLDDSAAEPGFEAMG